MFTKSHTRYCQLTKSSETPYNKDVHIKYYRDNFIINEEKFYGCISDNILLIKQNIMNSPQTSNHSLSHLIKFNELNPVYLSNFGYCYIGFNKEANKKSIVKHLITSNTKCLIRCALSDLKFLKTISKNVNFERLYEVKLVENPSNSSIWCLFEYNESLPLENIIQMLHMESLGYTVSTESEYVHLLYSCNSILDLSKVNYPDFLNLIIYFISQLINAISVLHNHNIVHRDIQPANIRITLTGILKITEFGKSKKYKWLKYNGNSYIEPNIDDNNTIYKNPIKRIKLGGSFYYLEPHIRAVFTDYDNCVFDDYQMNDIGYHMDYFSLAMIAFEMVFGFTYGDIDLFDSYSFYRIFKNCELAFFFPDYFFQYIKKTKENQLLITDFKTYTLNKLPNFVINQGNGLLDFILNGLQTSVDRYYSIITINHNYTQFIDIKKLKQNYACFKNVNFDDIINETPQSFFELINKYKTLIRFKVLPENPFGSVDDIENNREVNISPFTLNSCDSENYCIPEVKTFEKPSPKFIHDINLNNSSSNRENLINYNRKNPKRDREKKYRKNIRKMKTENFLNLISECKNNLLQIPIKKDDNNDRFKHPNLFFNEFLRNLQNSDDADITDSQLHNFMKSKISQLYEQNKINTTNSLSDDISMKKIELLRKKILKYKHKNSILNTNSINPLIKKNKITADYNSSNNIIENIKSIPERNNYSKLNERINEILKSISMNNFDIANQSNQILNINTCSRRPISKIDFIQHDYDVISKKSKLDENKLLNETSSLSDTTRRQRFLTSQKRHKKKLHQIKNIESNLLPKKSSSTFNSNDTKMIINKSTIPLLDSKVMEVLSRQENRKELLQRYNRNDILNSSLSITKYLFKNPKMAFIRPIDYANKTDTNNHVIRANKNNEIQCNIEHSFQKDAQIQTIDPTKIKSTDNYEAFDELIDYSHDCELIIKQLIDEYRLLNYSAEDNNLNDKNNFNLIKLNIIIPESWFIEFNFNLKLNYNIESYEINNAIMSFVKDAPIYYRSLENYLVKYSTIELKANNIKLSTDDIISPEIDIITLNYSFELNYNKDTSERLNSNEIEIFIPEILTWKFDFFYYRPKLCFMAKLEILEEWLHEELINNETIEICRDITQSNYAFDDKDLDVDHYSDDIELDSKEIDIDDDDTMMNSSQ